MKSIVYLILLCTFFVRSSFAQIGMGGQPHPSAALDVKATDKAFYPPRLTTVQRKAIMNPQPGAFVYDLDQSTFYLFDGVYWLPLALQNPASVMPTTRLASDGTENDYFGYSVAISGDYAIIGAYNKTINSNSQQGAAYVFVRSGSSWTQQVRLTASDGAASDYFGYSVAISGDYAIVGAYNKTIGSNSRQGAAYVFVRGGGTWTQQGPRLTASDGAASDLFGYSVAISGDYAIVGAHNKTIGSNSQQGAAYVFVRSGSSWTQQVRLTASDGAASDIFGFGVAISGDYALVSAYFKAINSNPSQGAAYVFVRGGGTWTQQGPRLTASDGTSLSYFGYSVAISGDYALVGAYGRTINSNSEQGAAYVFVRSGSSWTQQVRLTASDGAAVDRFGWSVAISGDYALVGAYNKNIGSNIRQGAAYLFKRNGTAWPQLRAITDTSPADTRNGTSVGITTNNFIIGGPSFQSNQGKVSFGVIDN